MSGRVHWSFWLISVLALIWHLMGCANYISQMNPDVVAAMPDIYRAVVESRPAWATAAFAVAIFAGLVASLLLLWRKSAAVYVFMISLVGAVVAQFPYLGTAPAMAILGGSIQIVVTLFLIWYVKRAARSKVQIYPT